nr:serine/threonine protein kinase [Pseudenhygromyxa sp. WMMC2535]
MVGKTLGGRYEIFQRLGAGGMGTVYRGQHATLARPVAIKVLSPSLARDAALVERFLREARTTASIGHQNIVDISDVDQLEDGTAYFAMELLEGRELASLLRREGPLPWPRAREILIQIARALGAAHRMGVVHRDIKPGNVYLIQRRGTLDFVKLLDFGVAKVEHERSLTRAGMVLGTASYMAPEQAVGETVDGRTDLYALCCVAFEMLTGRRPFPGNNYLEVMARHVQEPPPRPSSILPSLPPAIDALLLRGLAKLPEHRFADMQAFEQALFAIECEDGPAEHETPAGHGAALESGPPMQSFPSTQILEPIAREATMMIEGLGRETLPELDSVARPVDQLEGDLGPTLMASLAFLLIAFAHSTDGQLTTVEIRTLAARLRAWAPSQPLQALALLLKATVAEYSALPPALEGERTHACAEQLGYALPPAQRARVLEDLRAIASADGQLVAAEQRFVDELVERFGLRRDPRIRACAFIYLALGQASDGALDPREMQAVAGRLQAWMPEASLAEIGEVLREAVDTFKELRDHGARLDHALRCADQLAASTDEPTRRRVLADLWSIAGADEQIAPGEQRFIMNVVDRFGALR